MILEKCYLFEISGNGAAYELSVPPGLLPYGMTAKQVPWTTNIGKLEISGTPTEVGTFTITPTAVAVKAEALLVVRQGDTGTLTAIGTIAPPAVPPTGPVVGNVIVSDAGQDKAHGN